MEHTAEKAKPGLYVISLSNAVDKFDGILTEAPLATLLFEQWLSVCPKLTLDGLRPTVQQLMERVGHAWIPDEAIHYIGRAKSLRSRLNDLYRTPIGAKRPHSGGHFLKLLSNFQQLWVHYAECPDPSPAEEQMLRRFCENVSGESTRGLFDCAEPFAVCKSRKAATQSETIL